MQYWKCGHVKDVPNTFTSTGKPRCRVCLYDGINRYRRRAAAALRAQHGYGS